MTYKKEKITLNVIKMHLEDKNYIVFEGRKNTE